MERMTWEWFLHDIQTIYEISQQLKDNWQIVTNNHEVAGTYLVKIQSVEVNTNECSDELQESEFMETDLKVTESHSFESSSEAPVNHSNQQLIRFEYHVLFHISYAVPYLCFNAFKSNGSLLMLDEAWNIFNDLATKESKSIHQNMLNVLTQMEHPVLFKPFLTLHPCRISEVLQTLPHSQNKVLTFLSIYGPTVYLTFDLEYGKYLEKLKNDKENENAE